MPDQKPLSAEDLYALKFVEDAQLSPDGTRLAFVKVDIDRLGNQYQRHLWLARLEGRRPTISQFTFSAKSDYAPRWSPDGQTLAFVSTRGDQPQIYLIALAGGEARPLTALPHGATQPTWSPDGRQIAFLTRVNAEERAAEDAGQTPPAPSDALDARHRAERREQTEKDKADPRVITRLPYRTGTAYLDDRRSHIYLVDVAEGARPPRRLTDGDLDFNHLAWLPDGSALVSTQSRRPEYDPWDYRAVVRVPVRARGRGPLRWLTPADRDYTSPQVSPDGRWIAANYVQADGSWGQITRLAVFPVTGGPARELSRGLDRAVAEPCWSADSRWVYFLANDQGDTHVYRAGARAGGVEQVVGGRRMLNSFSLDAAGNVAFTATTPERPGDVFWAPASGRERRLTHFNDALLAERVLAPIETAWHAAPDGQSVQGWLLKPIGFRAGRKYPLVVSMHGGPWVMWGPSQPGMWLEWQLQAARGYAVYFCNPRGSEGYGEAWSLSIRNDWGDHVMRDILSGLDAVLAQGWVDRRRLALTGGSYAGYMTAWIIGHDARFACAWAQRGLYSLTSFFGTTDIPQLVEREFETFGFDDVDKLWRQSPLAYVRNIRTPLAIEHQDLDWRCPPSEAEQLYAALKRLKREVVLIRYPREGHEMSRAGEPRHRVDRLNRMVAWFDQHCRPRR